MPEKPPRTTLPASERLSSLKVIEELFQQGQSVFAYPLKLQYMALEERPTSNGDYPFLFSVTVPKKLHKKAVTRNLLKRRIREAYRLHKPSALYTDPTGTQYALMYICVSKDVVEYDLLAKAMGKVNNKMIRAIKGS